MSSTLRRSPLRLPRKTRILLFSKLYPGQQRRELASKEGLFITLLGQSTFAKLKVLASPTAVSDLTMDAIMEQLIGHYRPQTIKKAERFKFLKRNQREMESATEFMAELWGLAKTCN